MKLRDFIAVITNPYEIEFISIYSPAGKYLGNTLYNDDSFMGELETLTRFGDAIVKSYDVVERELVIISENLG